MSNLSAEEIQQLHSTNSKLAAEIAELKADVDRLTTARDEANESVTLNYNTILQLREIITETKAELEAARKERDAVEKLKEMAHSAAVTWQQRAETYHEAVQRTEAERDTALAAKDAAEKRVADLEAALKVADERLHLICGTAMAIANGESEKEFWKAIDEMGPDMTVVRNALTPAPTQEPPAGGVTISNDSVNSETQLGPKGHVTAEGANSGQSADPGAVTISTEKKGGEAGMFIESPPMKGASDVRPEGRPADVPPEGRGKWMPIETLDKSKMQFVLIHDDGQQRALLWNPRGYWEHPHPAGQRYDGNPTEWMKLPLNPMLPTEGSGA